MARRKKSAASTGDRPSTGQFAYDRLDRVLHEKARLGIMTSLYTHPDGLLFADLKHLCSLTDGNLSRHLQVLNDAGLIEIWKGFHKRRPQTLCRLTAHGRTRFLSYVEELEGLVKTVESFSSASAGENGRRSRASRRGGAISQDWVPA